MENYNRILFLGSPAQIISSSVTNRDMSNSLSLFSNNNFYDSNSRDDHGQVKQLVLDFDENVEASSKKYGDDSKTTIKEKKSGTKKGDKAVKSHKFAFQTRSQIDILDDGYRWRKYGQKVVKNSKFPRSYYKCTFQGCKVKKQIQRLSRDEGIVVTTYEGNHIHSIDKASENFDEILKHMQTSYTSTF